MPMEYNVKDVFKDLPLNTNKSFVGAKTKNGCEVFIPTRKQDVQREKLKELKACLEQY